MKTKRFVPLAAWLALLFTAGLCFGGIPEPETLIYGDVYNTAGGRRIPMTAGTVAWTLKGREGDAARYDLSTAIRCMDCVEYADGECVACNDYGYRLAVPQEAIASGADASAGVVPLTGDNRPYDYLSVTVDEAPARLVLRGQAGNNVPAAPLGAFILAGQQRRSHYYRVDLEVADPPADRDGDGIPDYWETANGLKPADPADAPLDPDGDGWNNLAEYLNNADPYHDNRIPGLPSDPVRGSERGATQFRLAILDSDTPPESVTVQLTDLPEGISLSVLGESPAGDSGTRLAVGDVLTLRDMIEGNILLHCGGGAAAPVIGVSVSDGDHHPPLEPGVPVSVFRPSETNGADALLWADAAHFAGAVEGGASPSVLPDRSGRGYDGNAVHYADDGRVEDYPLPATAAAPSGLPALALDGTAWIELPYGETVFPGGDATLLAVFRATAETDGIVASGPYFEAAVTGADHRSHPREIRVSTDSETVYGDRSVRNQWRIAKVRREDGETRIETGGLWTGGPQSHPVVRELGTDPVIGARTEWTWDFDKNDWRFHAHNIFDGDLAELLMFNRPLTPQKAWRIHAYLRAKWFGAVVNDQSDATARQDLMGASRAEWEKQQAKADAASQTLQAYALAMRNGDEAGAEAALGAFGDLATDHAAWSGTLPPVEEVEAAYTLYRDAVLFDYQRDFVARFGPEPPYVMLGGFAGDAIAGGFEADLLVGGPGPDTLRGMGGKDLFVVGDGDVVEDFDRSDGDILDISHLLADPAQPLSACVHMEIVNDPQGEEVHTKLRIDADGDGSGFDDAEILLRSVVLRDTDLPGLWANGHLHTGGVRPRLRLSLEADAVEALEVGGTPGVFSIVFSGPAAPEDLTVPLTFGGDADFGADYRLEAMLYDPLSDAYTAVPLETGRVPVRLKPGDSILTVKLIPVADGVPELVETARVGLMPKSGYYGLGEPSAVDIDLSDGPAEVRIAASGPAAHESGQATGRVTLSRTGGVETALNVRLSFQGTAVNGTDYAFIPSEVEIPAGQVTASFPVSATEDAETEPREYAEIFVVAGDGYVTAGPSSVRVAILDITAPIEFAEGDADGDGLPDDWETQYGLDPQTANGDGDPDADGFTNLEEYACGTNPVDASSAPAPPLADAGPDRIVPPGTLVALSALNSVGADGEPLTVSWRQTGGPPVDLGDAQSARPSFVAPNAFTGALTFEALVTSGCGGTATARCIVNVTADGRAPTALATASPALLTGAGDTATLDAGGSANADGAAAGLSYRWRQCGGPEAALSDPTAVRPTFPAPVAGAALLFELTVTDDATGLKGRDRVAVNVDAGGRMPADATASADPDPVREGRNATLTVDGAATAYRWRQTAGPPTTLSDPRAPSPDLLAPDVGPEGADLRLEVAATDGNGLLTLSRTGLAVTDDPSGEAFDDGELRVKTGSGKRIGVTAEGLTAMRLASSVKAPASALYDPIEMDVKSLAAEDTVTVSLPEKAPEDYVWYARNGDTGEWTPVDEDRVFWNAARTAAQLVLSGKGSELSRYQLAIAPAGDGTPDDGDAGLDGGSGGGGDDCFIGTAGRAGAGWFVLMLASLAGAFNAWRIRSSRTP